MEKAFVKWLGEYFGNNRFEKIGIGDDCAVLNSCGSDLVVTTDTVCEGVHFRSSELTPEQIGRKALAVNLSDLASMGALPRTALVALTLPLSSSTDFAKRLYFGMDALAKKYDIGICGGDTTVWDGQLVLSITAIGLAPVSGAWTIAGAKPGDQIVVTGHFGGSILERHWAFEPRLNFSNQWRQTNGPITACTDASDSLGIDLAKMARASNVGFELDLESIPLSLDSVTLAKTSGKSALQHALTDGEDFELIMAVETEGLSELFEKTKSLEGTGQETRLTRIGEFTTETDLIAASSGSRIPFDPQGFEHSLEGHSG